MYAISVSRELEASVSRIGRHVVRPATNRRDILGGEWIASDVFYVSCAFPRSYTLPLSNYIIDVIKNIVEDGKIAFSLAF